MINLLITMGIAEMEEVVSTVRAILKTLECPICLELLKTPISAGCGHFFCRQCASGILQSTYRAPCPLCKRSFTRRSVQEAVQRQSVISAAKILAKTCTNLTGVKFMSEDISSEETKKSDVSVPQKKFKSANQENKDIISRKRKSYENEVDVINAVHENVSDLKTKECNKVNGNLPSDEYSSPNKKACPDSLDDDENEDSNDLPTLEDVLERLGSKQKSVIKETVLEKPLSIQPTDKVFELKTYSSAHKKAHKQNCVSPFDKLLKDASKEKTSGSEIKNGPLLQNATCNVQEKNKINALKNKTNEVQPDHCKLDEDSITKKLIENKVSKTDPENNTSKENEVSHLIRKLKCKKKSQAIPHTDTNVPSNLLVDKVKEKRNTKKNESLNQVDTTEKRPTSFAEDSCDKECYTLNQVTLLHSQDRSDDEECPKKPSDDPYEAMGLSDTAVSVDSVTSPLATKNLLVHKSPGWSRVKKGKKDFKMKQFASLPVEKNSPSSSLKNAVLSDQEASSIDKSDHTLDSNSKDKLLNSRHEEAVVSEAGKSIMPTHIETHNENENIILSEVERPLVSNDNGREGILKNTDKFCGEICEEMDCSVDNEQECSANNTYGNVLNASNMKEVSELRIVPSVNITSNSLICTKYSDSGDKTSKSVLKAQKINCELQKSSLLSNMPSKNGNIVSDFIVHDDFNMEKNKSLSFSNTSEIQQSAITLPTHISEYQGLHAQSFQNRDNFPYVEQSQQTSQVFNINFQNPICDNLRVMIPHQAPHIFYPNTEKTKVVKRTCLTLEEIQDCFVKSSQTGCAETICSVPFLSGQFKLHIGVSDETLNVSVLKIIDPASENNIAPNAVSLLSDKCIQASNSLFPPTEVVPSSNAGSESPKSDSASHDPFPYLNSQSSGNKTSQFTHILPNKMAITESTLAERIVSPTDESASPALKSSVIGDDAGKVSESNCEDEETSANEEDLDYSEIIHFPPKTTDGDISVHKGLHSEPLLQTEDSEHHNLEKTPASMECDLPAVKDSVQKGLNSEPSPQTEDTEHHHHLEKTPASMECDSPAVKDSVHKGLNSEPLPQIESSEHNHPEKTLTPMDCDLLAIKDCSSSMSHKTNIPSKTEQIDEVDLLDSEEEPLKKLQQCVLKERSTSEKKQSRLSLKRKSAFRRVEISESSDESDPEMCVADKELSKEGENHLFSKPADPPKLASAPETLSSLNESNKIESLEKVLHNSVPSTLNSILSEDASQGNASEIILEIEDLSHKIKSLEEKLKFCGHEKEQLNESSAENVFLNESDSEDSTDLFPQSVPPTPPNRI